MNFASELDIKDNQTNEKEKSYEISREVANSSHFLHITGLSVAIVCVK